MGVKTSAALFFAGFACCSFVQAQDLPQFYQEGISPKYVVNESAKAEKPEREFLFGVSDSGDFLHENSPKMKFTKVGFREPIGSTKSLDFFAQTQFSNVDKKGPGSFVLSEDLVMRYTQDISPLGTSYFQFSGGLALNNIYKDLEQKDVGQQVVFNWSATLGFSPKNSNVALEFEANHMSWGKMFHEGNWAANGGKHGRNVGTNKYFLNLVYRFPNRLSRRQNSVHHRP